jgi:hypothetical protein
VSADPQARVTRVVVTLDLSDSAADTLKGRWPLLEECVREKWSHSPFFTVSDVSPAQSDVSPAQSDVSPAQSDVSPAQSDVSPAGQEG